MPDYQSLKILRQLAPYAPAAVAEPTPFGETALALAGGALMLSDPKGREEIFNLAKEYPMGPMQFGEKSAMQKFGPKFGDVNYSVDFKSGDRLNAPENEAWSNEFNKGKMRQEFPIVEEKTPVIRPMPLNAERKPEILSYPSEERLDSKIPGFSMLPQGRKGDNLKEMYVGAEPDEEGAFDPLWDKGKTRREISDEGFKLNWNRMPEGVISNVGWQTKHPELFKKYPEIQNMKFIKNPNIAGRLRGTYGEEEISIDPTLNEFEAPPVALHELQHAIQEKEGWARGGNPEEFKVAPENIQRAESELKAINQAIILKDYIGQGMSLGDAKEKYRQMFEEEPHVYAGQYAKFMDVPYLQKLEKEQLDVLGRDPSGMDMYLRQAGEIEARDTASRKDLTMEQRRTTQPYSGQGIPLNKVIVRRAGGKMASEEQPSGRRFADVTSEDFILKPEKIKGLGLNKIAVKVGEKVYSAVPGENGIWNHSDLMDKYKISQTEKRKHGFTDFRGRFIEQGLKNA